MPVSRCRASVALPRPSWSRTCPAVSVPTWRSTVNWRPLRSSLPTWTEATRKQLDRGARVTELLKQAQYSPLSISTMAATLFAVNKGFMDDVDVKKVLAFEAGLHGHLKDNHAALMAKLEADKAMDKDAEAELSTAVAAFKKSFA